MTEVKMSDLNTNETAKPQPKQKPQKPTPLNNPPSRHHNNHTSLPEESFNNFFNGLIPEELKGGVKNLLLYGLALPMKKQKRRRMLINLHSSKYTDMYLNKYLHVDMLSGLGDHEKFALTYAMNFIDAWMSADVMEPLPEHPPEKQLPKQPSENI